MQLKKEVGQERTEVSKNLDACIASLSKYLFFPPDFPVWPFSWFHKHICNIPL